MPFSRPVHTEWLDDGECMRLLVMLAFVDRAGIQWIAPAGFTTDGASIPPILWSLIGSPFNGKYRLPAVIHDAAYNALGMPKADADRMFYEAMRDEGVGRLKAWLMFTAVRLFGRKPYTQAQDRARLREAAEQVMAESLEEDKP